LSLDRQVNRRLHGRRAVGQDRCAPIRAGRSAHRHHHVSDAVELNGGRGDFGQLRGRLAIDGSARHERLSNGAELTGLGPALIANTGLQHRGCEYVATVKYRDFPVGNSVRRAAVIEARSYRKAHIAKDHAVAADVTASERIRLLDYVRTLEGRRRVHRHHDSHAVDGHCLMVGRSRAASAALVAYARINEPNSVGLQLVDQLFGRHRCQCRRLHRTHSHSTVHGGGPTAWSRSPWDAPDGCRG
jgi:hypothetical protein